MPLQEHPGRRSAKSYTKTRSLTTNVSRLVNDRDPTTLSVSVKRSYTPAIAAWRPFFQFWKLPLPVWDNA